MSKTDMEYALSRLKTVSQMMLAANGFMIEVNKRDGRESGNPIHNMESP
jgi:hypothetical protein